VRYIVEVSDCTEEQADRVIAERIDHDEDYGFPYVISWAPEVVKGWHVVNNVTGHPASKDFDTEAGAAWLCRSMNMDLGRNGGGLYGVERST
jgi:hypothetical protein